MVATDKTGVSYLIQIALSFRVTSTHEHRGGGYRRYHSRSIPTRRDIPYDGARWVSIANVAVSCLGENCEACRLHGVRTCVTTQVHGEDGGASSSLNVQRGETFVFSRAGRAEFLPQTLP